MIVDSEGKLFVSKRIVTRKKTIDAIYEKYALERDKS